MIICKAIDIYSAGALPLNPTYSFASMVLIV